MKKRIQGIVLGVLIYTLVMSGISFASNLQKEIDVTYRDIKLVVDDVNVTPRDVNGNIVEPFIYKGTTYLPVRAVGEALNREVLWDNNTSTVHINEKQPKMVYLYDIKPASVSEEADFYSKEVDSVKYIGFRPLKSMQRTSVSGMYHVTYFIFKNRVTYKLDENAIKLSGDVISLKTDDSDSATAFYVNVYNDKGGLLLKELRGEFEINVKGLKSITFEFSGSSDSAAASPCVIKDLVMYVNN